MAVDDRGHFYVGGRFDQISGVSTPGLAGWDGERWYSLGKSVTAMAPAPGGGLYAAVRDEGYTVLERWVDRRWERLAPLGSIRVHVPLTADVPVVVDHIVVGDDEAVYVSGCAPRGRFDPVGRGILQLDGSEWIRLPGTPDCVRFIQYQAGYLFAEFDAGFHRWDVARQEWDLVAETGHHYHARAIDRDRLIAVTVTGSTLVQWADGQWTPALLPIAIKSIGSLGAGADGRALLTVTTEDEAIILGFDGERWAIVASPVQGWGVEAHSDSDGNIYLRGGLTLDGGERRRVARWDGREWQSITQLGLGATAVTAVVVDRSGDLFVHLDRWNDQVIGDQVGKLVRWTGDGWQRIDPPEGTVYSVSGDANSPLCAETRVPSSPAWTSPSVQCWQDGAWVTREPFPCPNQETEAFWRILTTDHHGREFVSFRCGGESGVALRDEGVWRILGYVAFPAGSELAGYVSAATTDDAGGLFIGGEFTRVDEIDASAVAYWDGSQWHSLAGGLTYEYYVSAKVQDLAWHDGLLYAGGHITGAGALPVGYIVAWDGARWTQVGEGVNDVVGALIVDTDGILYAGGYFTWSGTRRVNRVARWDGRSWTPMASGIDGGAVTSLAIDSDGALWAGGEFNGAGGHATLNIARWIPAGARPQESWTLLENLEVYPNPTTGWVNLHFLVPEPGVYTGTLYDPLGRQVQEIFSAELAVSTEQALRIDTSRLASGMYYLVIRGRGEQKTVPILRIRP